LTEAVGDRTLADGERGGDQQSEWHTAELRTDVVSTASSGPYGRHRG